MSRICELCGKKAQNGNQVTIRGKAKYLGGVGTKVTGITKRKFQPNLQRVRASVNGGTKTILATASRDGVIDTWLEGAGINPVDNPDWLAGFEAQIRAAGAAAQACDHAVLALPAYGEIAAVTQSQNQAAASALGQSHAILNDVEAAHVAAFAGGPGVLILAGTGSMAWARDEHGNSLRVGGWGDAFGDEGSAFWIGRETIARVSQALDGRLTAPALADAFFSFLALDRADRPHALLQWHVELSHPRSQIAALSVLVDRLAETGNATAVAILDEAAEHLARHVGAAWRRMDAKTCRSWSYAGGVDYELSPTWTVRGGIQYDETPTRNGNRDARVPDADRWNFALGTSFKVTQGITIDAAANYITVKDATIDRTTAAFAGTAVQTPILVSGELEKAHVVVLGLGAHLAF